MRDLRPAIAFVAFAAAIFSAPCAAPAQNATQTADQRQVMATVHRFADSVNHNDLKTAASTCAPQSAVIDEFPPHVWQGSGCAKWAQAFVALNKAQGITDAVATLKTPTRLSIDGNSAYVVMPSSYSYKQHGKSVTESGATLTVALERIGGSWKIAAWAWSAH